MRNIKLLCSLVFAFYFGFYFIPAISNGNSSFAQTVNSCNKVVVKVQFGSQSSCPLPGYYRIADIACDGVHFFVRYGPNEKACMTVKEWENYARQICGCVDPVPTALPTQAEPSPTPTPTQIPVVGPTCRILEHSHQWPNDGPDVHRYDNEQECMTKCPVDFPGRNCRSLFNDGYYPQKTYCVADICSFDGISIWESGLPQHPSAFTKVRKNNSCPAKSYVECMDGFLCELTADGIKVTMVDSTKINSNTQGWPWHIGLNCPCQENIKLPIGGEIFDSNFCESFNHGWLGLYDLKNGESFECSYSTLNCKKN